MFFKPSKIEFTSDWFSCVLPVLEPTLQSENFFSDRPINYIEIGVYEGRSLKWMLENVLVNSGSSAMAIDTFYGDYEDRFLKNVKHFKGAEKVKVIKGEAQKILPNLLPESADIIFLDADHTSQNTLELCVLCWPLLKKGGLLIQDYRYDDSLAPEDLRPQMAIDAFVKIYGNTLSIVKMNLLSIVKKAKLKSTGYAVYLNDQYYYHFLKRKLYDRNTLVEVKLGEKQIEYLHQIIAHRRLSYIEEPDEAVQEFLRKNVQSGLNAFGDQSKVK